MSLQKPPDGTRREKTDILIDTDSSSDSNSSNVVICETSNSEDNLKSDCSNVKICESSESEDNLNKTLSFEGEEVGGDNFKCHLVFYRGV